MFGRATITLGIGRHSSLYFLYFPSYDVINDVIMSDADCTPGREPRSVAAIFFWYSSIKKLHCDNYSVSVLRYMSFGLYRL